MPDLTGYGLVTEAFTGGVEVGIYCTFAVMSVTIVVATARRLLGIA